VPSILTPAMGRARDARLIRSASVRLAGFPLASGRGTGSAPSEASAAGPAAPEVGDDAARDGAHLEAAGGRAGHHLGVASLSLTWQRLQSGIGLFSWGAIGGMIPSRRRGFPRRVPVSKTGQQGRNPTGQSLGVKVQQAMCWGAWFLKASSHM